MTKARYISKAMGTTNIILCTATDTALELDLELELECTSWNYNWNDGHDTINLPCKWSGCVCVCVRASHMMNGLLTRRRGYVITKLHYNYIM